MKRICKFFHAASVVALAFALASCSKPDSDDNAGGGEKKEEHEGVGVTLDAVAQTKLGVEIGQPVVADWQAGVSATGKVLDPLALHDALADLRHAQLAHNLASQEFERAKKLKEQNNISARTYQDAEGAFLQSEADMATAERKMESVWGGKILAMARASMSANSAEGADSKFLFQQLTDSLALVRVDLPVGYRFSDVGGAISIQSLAAAGAPLAAETFDVLPSIDPQSQQQGVLVTVSFTATNRLSPGEMVIARVAGGPKTTGVAVPDSAVLRYQGRGWVYVQTGTNQFVRVDVPLDQERETNYFIGNALAETNRIVVSGAQSVLSAELGGGFTTGDRD